MPAATQSTEPCDQCRIPASDGESLVRALRLAGFQVPPPREAVVRTVAAYERPFTAGQLCDAVAARDPSVGRATVFRTLELLEREGLVDRVHLVTGTDRYVRRDVPDEHSGERHPRHYLVCSACEGISQVADARIDATLAIAARQHAFRPEGNLVQIYGRCQEC